MLIWISSTFGCSAHGLFPLTLCRRGAFLRHVGSGLLLKHSHPFLDGTL
jgi:hypothetical protein